MVVKKNKKIKIKDGAKVRLVGQAAVIDGESSVTMVIWRYSDTVIS